MDTQKTNYGVLALIILGLSGCGENTSLVPIPTPAAETPQTVVGVTETPSPPIDVYRIVSTGDSLSFNNQTGGVNDIALSPVTKAPAIIYYDKSATTSGGLPNGALKYAYVDSTGAWKIELVDSNSGTTACGSVGSSCLGAPNSAGGNTATIMKLAFKSDGSPVIAYVYGSSAATVGGTKQIRFAERASDGTWSVTSPFLIPTAVAPTNVATAATVDPMKAVTLNLDSANRPHITFNLYTQTLTNSRIVYLFRSSNGVWTQSTIAPALNAPGTITAVGQGANQAGSALCAANGRLLWTSFVVDGAAGVGKPLYITCTATDSAGACSTFDVLNLSTGCTGNSCFSSVITNASNAGARTDIAIDATSQRPIVGIYATATPATSLLTVAAPNACDVAQTTGAGTWGAPTVVGAASQGLHGFRLASSNATLDYNFLAYLTGTTSVTLNRATGIGAWFATGTTVETTTVSSEGLGLVYDPTNDAAYVSYAATPAAAVGALGNDIKVAQGNADDVTNAGAAGAFALDSVDNTGNFFPTTALPMIAAAKSANGIVGYAYFFQDTAPADSKLYYGVKAGPATAPVFSAHTVVSLEGAASPQFVGSYPSLTYDSGNSPAIAFYNGVASQQNLNVARSIDGGATFSVNVVDNSNNVGMYPSMESYQTALGIAYYDATATGLKFARHTPTQGWKKFAVDGMAGTGSCGNDSDDAGSFATLRFTSTGIPVIAYQSQNALKLAIAAEPVTASAFTWTCVNVDNAASVRGSGISFALTSTNRMHLVHFDSAVGTVRYLTCPSDIATCIAGGATTFTASQLASSGSLTTVTTKPSLALTSTNTVHVAFHSVTQGLVLASLKAESTTWTETILEAPSATFTSLVGQYAQLLINASGYPSAFYRSAHNWLKFFSRELN